MNVTPIPSAPKEAKGESPMFIPIGKALTESIAPDWLVKTITEKCALMLVFGDSESGKSLVMLDFSLCVASGLDWRNLKTKQGLVIWIVSEGRTGIIRRSKAWSIHNDVDLSDKPFYISVVPAELITETSVASFRDEISRIAKQAGQQPSLIVIDTLAGNFGPGNESFPSDMSQVVNNVGYYLRDHFGATVAIVHHSGHADKDRHRGAGSLRAAADSEYKISQSKEGVVQVECSKMKDSSHPSPMAFQIMEINLGETDEDGELVTSVVPAPTEYINSTSAEKKGLGHSQKKALAILRKMYTERRANLEDGGHDPEGARVELGDWKSMLVGEGVLHGETLNNQYYKMKRRLCDRGLISIAEPFVYLKE